MPTWPWRKPRPGVDEYGRSPLWYAAMDGDSDQIRTQLKRGADPTASDKDGLSALHVAAEYGKADACRILIAAGADVNCLDRHGNGPLWVASRRALAPDGQISIVDALLAAGADPYHCNAAGKSPPGWADGDDPVRLAIQAVYKANGYNGPFTL